MKTANCCFQAGVTVYDKRDNAVSLYDDFLQGRYDIIFNENLIIHDFQRGLLGSAEMLPPRYLRPNLLKNVIMTDDDVETILISR